jgi:hypothetical protein
VANESTLTTYNDLYPASVVYEDILDEQRPLNAMTPNMFRYKYLPSGSTIVDFPIQDDPGAGAASTEGTGLSNAASGYSSSEASATLGTVGQMTTVTDELRDTVAGAPAVGVDMISHVAQVLGRSVAEKFQTDATALIDDFSNTTGTAAVARTAADLQTAVNKLAQRDNVGQPVGCLDPSVIGDISRDFGTSLAAVYGNPEVPVRELLGISLEPYAFSYANTPWVQTSLVTSTGGGVWISGVALGLAEQWRLKMETQRDASMPGTEVVAFARYGMIEVRDTAGETILT